MSATLLQITAATEDAMQSPTVLGAAKALWNIMEADFSEEQKAQAMFNYTAIVVSVAADKVAVAVLGEDTVESMFQEFTEIDKMGNDND